MIVPFHGEARQRRRAPLAALVVALTVALTAANLLSIEMAGLAGRWRWC